jgi:2-polyprenyl-6-methoxyphenol hydroxylase-like FAD-dependent oxidoreductase
MALRIAIVGGSVGGLFAAALLLRAGHDVRVYERSRHGLDGRGAGLVAQREVFAILRDIGCEHIAEVGVVASERIFLDRSGAIVSRGGPPQMQISWDLLFRTFRALVPDDRYLSGAAVRSVEDGADEATIVFEDGTRVTADLVIGADGLGSVVRQAVLGGAPKPAYASYATWRGLVPEAALPAVASVLLGRFAFYEMRRSHILGYLVPGPDGSLEPGRRRYNWVWYREAPEADGSLARALTDRDGIRHDYSLARGAMSDAARDALRRDAFKLLPPPFAAAIAAEDAPFVQAIFDFAAERMTRGRLLLIGDAAFVARPHTAMGVSKAAGDAMTLRDLLAQALTLEAALQNYDELRRVVGNEIVAYGQRLGERLAR